MKDIAKLHAVLAKAGMTLTPTFTGEFQRNGSQYFRGIDLGNGLLWCVFGDWARKGSQQTWQASGAGVITEGDRERIAQALAEQDAERRRHWETVALEAQALWDNATDRGSHPYLEKKQLASLHGARIMMNEAGFPVMLIPMRDLEGKLWNVTRIFSKEFTGENGEKRGNKFVLKGGRKEGLFHLLGAWPPEGGRPILAEGFATAATLKEAFPEATVIACFDAGNLGPASRALFAGYSGPPPRFAGDDDCYKPEKGNAGRDAVRDCLSSLPDADARFPRFRDTRSLPTDWNDLRCLQGLDEVRAQWDAPEETLPERKPEDEEDRPKKNQEAIIVGAMIDAFAGNLIKQDKDIFEFNGSHWVHYNPRQAQDHFIKLIDARTGERLEFKKLKQVCERFLTYVPHVPRGRNMFAPPPLVTNFKNGTLELIPTSTGTYSLQFRPKHPRDLLCYSHPFDYPEKECLNAEFEATLERVLPGGGVDTYLEVLGTCLLPAFPKVCFFIGPPGSGKSTLILFAYHLIDPDLRCSVDPSNWRGFGMETMAGKNVNLVPDINLSKPISESMLKLIEDRIDVLVERKGITNIMAPIPALHLFGGNALPRTQEDVDAFTRRVLVIRCDKFRAPETGFIRDYAHHVWDQSPSGIVWRALEGLKRVAANRGHFTLFDGARGEMAKWKDDTCDWVQRFVNELQEPDFVISEADTKASLRQNGRVRRDRLKALFHNFLSSEAPQTRPPTSFELYRRLRELGFREYRTNTERGFEGFSMKEVDGAKF